jgi:hypothetical protein
MSKLERLTWEAKGGIRDRRLSEKLFEDGDDLIRKIDFQNQKLMLNSE